MVQENDAVGVAALQDQKLTRAFRIVLAKAQRFESVLQLRRHRIGAFRRRRVLSSCGCVNDLASRAT